MAWHVPLNRQRFSPHWGSARRPPSVPPAESWRGRWSVTVHLRHEQDLDEPRYQELLARACDYDIFADEKTRSVRKGGKVIENIPASYFRSIEAAVNSRRHFDPTVDGPELSSGKQIFQRARQSFDIKADGPSWKLFKTLRTEERQVVYALRPDSDVSFAFIFLPPS
jgi:hypothetical protein